MPDIVFIPGFTRNQHDYQKLRSTVPENYELCFVEHSDLFVGGKFSPAIGINNFLRKNNLSKIVLAGHSLGGAIALDFAHRQPEKVDKLFLIDSAAISGDESFLARARNILLEHRLRVLARNIRAFWIVVHNPRMHLKLARYVHFANFEMAAKGLKVPTVILWGERDYIMPLWKGEKLQKNITKSKLIVFKDRGHDWILNEPELFSKNF